MYYYFFYMSLCIVFNVAKSEDAYKQILISLSGHFLNLISNSDSHIQIQCCFYSNTEAGIVDNC